MVWVVGGPLKLFLLLVLRIYDISYDDTYVYLLIVHIISVFVMFLLLIVLCRVCIVGPEICVRALTYLFCATLVP